MPSLSLSSHNTCGAGDLFLTCESEFECFSLEHSVGVPVAGTVSADPSGEEGTVLTDPSGEEGVRFFLQAAPRNPSKIAGRKMIRNATDCSLQRNRRETLH